MLRNVKMGLFEIGRFEKQDVRSSGGSDNPRHMAIQKARICASFTPASNFETPNRDALRDPTPIRLAGSLRLPALFSGRVVAECALYPSYHWFVLRGLASV